MLPHTHTHMERNPGHQDFTTHTCTHTVHTVTYAHTHAHTQARPHTGGSLVGSWALDGNRHDLAMVVPRGEMSDS